MFVAYLDHDRPGIQIQDRNCWHLEVEAETSKEMVSDISGEGEKRAGESLHGFSKPKPIQLKVGLGRTALPYRSGFPARPCWAVQIPPFSVVACSVHRLQY